MHLPAVALILTGKTAFLLNKGTSLHTLLRARKQSNDWQSKSETINKAATPIRVFFSEKCTH